MSQLLRLAGIILSSIVIFACNHNDDNTPSGSNPAPLPTYSIGGSITGYTGSGLQLSNNGENLSLANSEASFTFLNKLDGGASYNIVVRTQPTSPVQRCDITNASGTVSSQDITNVIVNCAITQFNVNLNIVGYDGDGLVVNHNGTDYPISTGSSSFQLPTPLDDLSMVDITITTNPSNPAQTCQGATGSINGMDLQLNIVCTTPNTASWSTATLLATNVDYAGPYILSDGNNNSLAIWEQNGTLMARHYIAGMGWQAAQNIGNDGGQLEIIGFDMASNGNALVIWLNYSNNTFYTNNFSLLDNWGTAAPLGFSLSNKLDGIDRGNKMMSINTNGQAILAWRTSTNTLARYLNNGVWSSEMIIATRSRFEGGIYTEIAETGNAAVAWDDNFSLLASHYTPAGGWEINTKLGARTTVDTATFPPRLQIGSNGLPVVVFLSPGNSGNNYPYVSQYNPATGWSTANVIQTDRVGQDLNFAIDNNDSLHVVTDAVSDLYGIIYSNGSWGSIDNISDSQTTETLDYTDVVDLASSAGTTITVWEGYFATTRAIWSSVYNSSTGWGQATPIHTAIAPDEVDAPYIAVDGTNQAIVVWRQWDNTAQQTNLYFSRYE